MDFDDTIVSRNYKIDEAEREASIKNLELINKMSDRIAVISGNSYESIKAKFSDLGINLRCDIWADANANLYRDDRCIESIDSLIISDDSIEIIELILDDIEFNKIGNPISCLKIKPVEDDIRDSLVDKINSDFYDRDISCTARKTGRTTIDILSSNNSKLAVLDNKYSEYRVLFIGDEVFGGNDREIAEASNSCINVKSVIETSLILEGIYKWYMDL